MEFIISKLINETIYTLYKNDNEYVLKYKSFSIDRSISVRKSNDKIVFSESIEKSDYNKVISMLRDKLK